MSQRQTVIYTAQTSQDAHLLKNLLAEVRIRAVVINETLERGSGVDAVGWATAARVVVNEEDAHQARQIALEFDRTNAASATAPPPEEPQAEPPPTVLHEWPTCPQCGARRSTRCRICGTAGTDFAVADMGFILMSDPEGPVEGSAGCSCGPGECTPSAAQTEPPSDEPPETGTPVVLLMCPTCDESFTPQYARRCQSCGHEFAEGYETRVPAPPTEQVNSRVIAVIAGLVVLMLGALGYLALVFR